MKRTGEKVLVWIGIILQFILIFLMAIITPFLNDVSVKNELTDVIYNSNVYDQGTPQIDASNLVDVASQIFLLALVIVIICTVFATGMSLSVIPASPSAEYEHSSLVFDHFVHGSHF